MSPPVLGGAGSWIFIGAFSCDSKPAGGGQLLKHCGAVSLSGGRQFIARVDTVHRAPGVGISLSLISSRVAPAGGAVPADAAPRVHADPLGYGPTAIPLLKPGAS